MHEYSLVESLLDQVDRIRREQLADHVVGIHVRVGQFAGVESDLLREAFEVLADDRWHHAVELTMDIVPLEAECAPCRQTFFVKDFEFLCPHCRSGDITVLRGEELILDTVTLEQNPVA